MEIYKFEEQKLEIKKHKTLKGVWFVFINGNLVGDYDCQYEKNKNFNINYLDDQKARLIRYWVNAIRLFVFVNNHRSIDPCNSDDKRCKGYHKFDINEKNIVPESFDFAFEKLEINAKMNKEYKKSMEKFFKGVKNAQEYGERKFGIDLEKMTLETKKSKEKKV